MTLTIHRSASETNTMGSSLSTLLKVSQQTVHSALQHILRTPFVALLLSPQNTWSPPPSIARPLSRERQRNRVDILAAEASPSTETTKAELFRYISHTGNLGKRVRIGVDVRVFENRLLPIPGFVRRQLNAPSITGIITGISSITENLVTLTIRDVDLKETFHLITPREVVSITRSEIRIHSLLRRLGLKRRFAYTEKEIFDAFRVIEVPYDQRAIPPAKPTMEREVRFLTAEQPKLLGMLPKPYTQIWAPNRTIRRRGTSVHKQVKREING